VGPTYVCGCVVNDWCIQNLESHGNINFRFSRPGIRHGIRSRSWKVMENKPNGCHFLAHCAHFCPLYALSEQKQLCKINLVFRLFTIGTYKG